MENPKEFSEENMDEWIKKTLQWFASKTQMPENKKSQLLTDILKNKFLRENGKKDE